MDDNEKYQIMVLLDHEKPKNPYSQQYDNFGKFYFRPVKRFASGKVRNFADSPMYPKFEPALYLAGLQFSCQYHIEDGRVSDPYGYRLEYKAFAVELEGAEKMVKTLRKIGKKMELYRQQWGNPQDFGSYAMRFLKAISAAGILIETGRRRQSAGYDDLDFQPWDVTELPWIVKNALGEVQGEIDKNKAA